MLSLSATVKLRPTRIALLTRPADTRSIKKFMRFSACLWGGAFNPIIPVMSSVPRTWRDPHGLDSKPRALTAGYISYFEPDAYVEAEPGLLEAAGLGAFRRKHAIHSRVIPLSALLAKQHGREWAEPALGLGIVDGLSDIYTRERRFELKQTHEAILVKPVPASLVTEVIFGCYPSGKAVDYIRDNYRKVYEPAEPAASPEAWKKAFMTGALTPLRFSRYKTEPEPGWRDGLTLFIFDPTNTLDSIDLWNMQSEPRGIIPVPIDWWDDLLPELRAILRAEHRPMRGNPHGVMHRGVIEFARSIDRDRAKSLGQQVGTDLPDGSVIFKGWRTPVWRPISGEDFGHRNGPLRIKAAEKRVTLSVDETDFSSTIEFLSPDFAYQHGGGEARWVNTIQPSQFHDDRLGTALPFNAFDPYSTMIHGFGEPVLVGKEGWSVGQRYKDASGRLRLPEAENTAIAALKRYGIEARLSEPGHIAKQILGHVGGLFGVGLLKDAGTLEMLNTMAGGIRRKGGNAQHAEELFDRRSKSIREWHGLVERRKKEGLGLDSLDDFTRKNVIRLGLQSRCPTCAFTNWHSLSVVDYDVICERCQKSYPFPQASLERNNANWAFRVVGPFAVPDYARGSYGALLALKAVSNMNMSQDRLSFSTALSLSFDGMEAEADFVALLAREKYSPQVDPELIICEAKSFGVGPLITAKDLTKLRSIAKKIEGAVIVVSVLRDRFLPEEVKILEPFVRWCRRPDPAGEMRNPVILLTGHEAFCKIDIGMTWKELGGAHAKFEDFRHRDSLRAFANATQAIYLGLPDFHAELHEKWVAKNSGRANAAS